MASRLVMEFGSVDCNGRFFLEVLQDGNDDPFTRGPDRAFGGKEFIAIVNTAVLRASEN
jgi:hypothetical protein